VTRRWPWLLLGGAALGVAAWALWPSHAGSQAGGMGSAATRSATAAPSGVAAAGPARVVDGRPLAGATRRDPPPATGGATELTGRIPAALEARGRGALASCAGRVGAGAGARVFVYLTVAIADQLTIVEVTSRGAEAPLATCLAQTLTQTTVDVPADAPRGRFQVTVSGVVAAPPSE